MKSAASKLDRPISKKRLDVELALRRLVASRSQAESYIRLGKVWVNGKMALKAGHIVSESDKIEVKIDEQYVSRAALKLKSADAAFRLDWQNTVVLDVGSSTGGFTQYALNHGAKKVIAVDVGTDQLHPRLRGDKRIELHEKTDIRDVWLRPKVETKVTGQESGKKAVMLATKIDVVVADVSFISLREILPSVARLVTHDSRLIVMVKPQFEAAQSSLKHKGVIKNDHMRREILKDFEAWVKRLFVVIDKVDSGVPGSKGNVERFYQLRKIARDNTK
jgi:23S rRNA (cytidine1920-2'-O)/16S rRNA (cytidine1409-2'-O)-methyltransferase